MPSLHQLNHAQKLETCWPLLSKGDSLLLLEAATSLAVRHDWQQELPVGVSVYALEKDLQARGLQAAEGVSCLSDARWVALTLEAERVCSW